MDDRGIQKQAFLEGEGDAYFQRNKDKKDGDGPDPYLAVIDHLKLTPTSILEIGCGSCQRLTKLRAKTGAACYGIDPSKAAIEAAHHAHPDLQLEVGTADKLPFPTAHFDLVIFGFCLYLVDPIDHFTVAREADRVLKDAGLLIIYDFSTPAAYANTYMHRDGIVARKMEWSRMFTWNPAYSLVHRQLADASLDQIANVDSRVTADVIRKDTSQAFPLRR